MPCHFIPPYLLSRVAASAARGSGVNPGAATLQVDDILRGRRTIRPALMPRSGVEEDSTRVIHSAHNVEQLPGEIVRRSGGAAVGDPAVDEAFDYSGDVWDLFAEQFGRPSVDGRGSALVVTVHYGQNYDNAFWDGQQLVFGDGDGQVFDRFTKPMDVMAHEFTHGVTQFTAALSYQGQSGALNESISDAFACMTKQRSLNQTADQADWLIGQGLFLPGVNAKALRSMTEPGTAYDDPQLGKDPQVATMADYVHTADDSGGVHFNSGIPNRAFALAARGVGGHSWEQVGHTWYDALTAGEVTADTDFAGFAQATLSSAERLFPDDADIAAKVRAAWTEVGVLSAEAPVPPAGRTPPVAIAGRISVRRSGGYAGTVRAGELNLDAEPDGLEVRTLLSGLDPQTLTTTQGAPDRFLYTVEYDDQQFTVPEQDLTPELHRVVHLVLRSDRA